MSTEKPEESRIITKKEMEENNNGKSCWISIHDRVYDCTKFLEEVSRNRKLSM